MTKNEDTSPWMRFPDNPKAIKRHNELVLSSIPTADLVAELSKRNEVEYRWRLKGRDEQWPDKHTIPICGPCKILVVRE